MTNLSIPDAKNVRPLEGAVIRRGTAGGAAAVGDWVYLASDGDWERCDGSEAATAEGRGIIVASDHGETTIAAGDGISVVTLGPVGGFASLTPGAVGYTSDDAGKLEDATGTVTWRAGYAESANIFFVLPGMAAAASS